MRQSLLYFAIICLSLHFVCVCVCVGITYLLSINYLPLYLWSTKLFTHSCVMCIFLQSLPFIFCFSFHHKSHLFRFQTLSHTFSRKVFLDFLDVARIYFVAIPNPFKLIQLFWRLPLVFKHNLSYTNTLCSKSPLTHRALSLLGFLNISERASSYNVS